MSKNRKKKPTKKHHGNRLTNKKSKKPNFKIPDSLKAELLNLFEKPNRLVRLIHLLIWIYISSKIFLTDYDLNYFTNTFPVSEMKYIFYRNVMFGISILITWSLIGNKAFYKNVVLFFLFPFYPVLLSFIILFFWKLPAYFIKEKHDFLLYSYIDNLVSLIAKFRLTLIKSMLLLLAFVILMGFENQILWIAVFVFGILQILHLYKRYVETFAPIKVFQIKLSSIKPKNSFSKEKFDKDLERIKPDQESKIEIAQMEYFLMISEFSKLFHRKIQDVLSTKSYFKGFLFKAIYSFFISIVLFGGINYAIYKIDPSNFDFSGEPEYFEFAYYSFFNIFSEGVDISPITRLAKSVRMIGVSVGVIINLLVLAVYFTVRTNRYKENLEYLSKWSIDYSVNVTSYFVEKYGKNPTDGMLLLKSAGSEITNIIEMAKGYLHKE